MLSEYFEFDLTLFSKYDTQFLFHTTTKVILKKIEADLINLLL